VAAAFSTFATREESTSISEQWDNIQQLADSRTVIKLRHEESAQRNFQISTIDKPEVKLSSEAAKEEGYTTTKRIARDANVALRSIESGDERVKVEVDLGLFDRRTRADASQNIRCSNLYPQLYELNLCNEISQRHAVLKRDRLGWAWVNTRWLCILTIDFGAFCKSDL
jgi:ribosomal protein L33